MNRNKFFLQLFFILSLTILFNNCATNLPATEPSVEEMDRANTIILEVKKSPDEAYRQIAQILNDRGHTFSNTDEVLRIISTEYKRNEGFQNYDYKISASVRENENTTLVLLKGMVVRADMLLGGKTEKQAMNTPAKSSFEHLVWNRLKEISEEFGYKNLMYQRQ